MEQMLLQANRSHNVTAVAWAPKAGCQTYTFATATRDAVHLFILDPFSGQSKCCPVTAGAVHKPIGCLCFSKDGRWLYGGSSSGEVVSVNTKRLSVQMTHPVMHGGVFAMAHVGQKVCSSCIHCRTWPALSRC